MKKIILILLLLFPILVYGKEVDKVSYEVSDVYINSTIDILGSMHVEEVIVTKGSLNKYTREIVVRDSSLPKYKEGDVDLESSSFYNARGLMVKTVSSFKVKEKDIGFKLLDKASDSYKKSKVAKKGDTKVYTEKSTNDGKIISIYNPNEEGYMAYYIEYFVDQAVVLHKDTAELYYKFIPSGGDNIKHLKMQVLTPGNSKGEAFKVWAHGSMNGEIKPLSNNLEESTEYKYSGALVELNDIKSTKDVVVRMLFDKDLMSISKKILNNSNMKAFYKIENIENNSIKKTNNNRTIKNVLNIITLASSGLFILGVIASLVMYIIKKGKKVSKEERILYIVIAVFGLFMSVINALLNKQINIIIIITIILDLIYVILMSILKNKYEGRLTPKKL